MTEALDRPVWNALNSRQASIAVAAGPAVRLDPDFGPFAAACDTGEEAQKALAATLRDADDRIWIVEREPWPAPPGAKIVLTGGLVQMIYEGDVPSMPSDHPIELLSEAEAAEMAELAHATEPGPWRARTHHYGDYYGVRIDDRLAAMAGERMKLPGLAELSGVATWPEFRGRGLAAALVNRVLNGFSSRGDKPFLHCYDGNRGAIELYERLGFRVRAQMAFTVLARD